MTSQNGRETSHVIAKGDRAGVFVEGRGLGNTIGRGFQEQRRSNTRQALLQLHAVLQLLKQRHQRLR